MYFFLSSYVPQVLVLYKVEGWIWFLVLVWILYPVSFLLPREGELTLMELGWRVFHTEKRTPPIVWKQHWSSIIPGDLNMIFLNCFIDLFIFILHVGAIFFFLHVSVPHACNTRGSQKRARGLVAIEPELVPHPQSLDVHFRHYILDIMSDVEQGWIIATFENSFSEEG